jgi:hypothetical protein
MRVFKNLFTYILCALFFISCKPSAAPVENGGEAAQTGSDTSAVLNNSQTYYKQMFDEWSIVPLCSAPDANVESLTGLSSTSNEAALAKGIQDSLEKFQSCVLDDGDDPFTGTYKIASLSLVGKGIKFLGWMGSKVLTGGKKIFKLEFWKGGKKVVVETPPMSAGSQPAEILAAAQKKIAGVVNWTDVKSKLVTNFPDVAKYLNGRTMKLRLEGQDVKFVLNIQKTPAGFSSSKQTASLLVNCSGDCDKVARLFAKAFKDKTPEAGNWKNYDGGWIVIGKARKNTPNGIQEIADHLVLKSKFADGTFLEVLISKGMTGGL